jgi:Ca2+-binding EF-hand superfamily protein
MNTSRFALACLAIVIPHGVSAQSGSDWVRRQLGGHGRPSLTWDAVWPRMLELYWTSNPNERGVTEEGTSIFRKVNSAQQRASAIAQHLVNDLDGDGRITREEVVLALQPRTRQMISANGVRLEPTPEQSQLQLDRLVKDAMKSDADGDGVITLAEINAAVQARFERISDQRDGRFDRFVPMSLDADGDGAVSRAELETAVRREFDSLDKDGDGKISMDELAAR